MDDRWPYRCEAIKDLDRGMQRMGQFNDISGKKYERLTVKSRADTRGGHVHWHCECSCGNVGVYAGKHIVAGMTKSCGCLKKDLLAQYRAKVAEYKTSRVKRASGMDTSQIERRAIILGVGRLGRVRSCGACKTSADYAMGTSRSAMPCDRCGDTPGLTYIVDVSGPEIYDTPIEAPCFSSPPHASI